MGTIYYCVTTSMPGSTQTEMFTDLEEATDFVKELEGSGFTVLFRTIIM